VPILVQLEDEDGRVVKRLARVHLTNDDVELASPGSRCVGFIDPYGDTLFNRVQIPALAEELDAIAASSTDEAGATRIRSIAEFARGAVGQVHTYLRFVGD